MTAPMTPEEALENATAWAEAAEQAARDITNSVGECAALSQAWAFVSLAGSNLVPLPEEIAAMVAEDMEAEAREAVSRLALVEAILDQGRRSGPRHPSILEALQVIRGT